MVRYRLVRDDELEGRENGGDGQDDRQGAHVGPDSQPRAVDIAALVRGGPVGAGRSRRGPRLEGVPHELPHGALLVGRGRQLEVQRLQPPAAAGGGRRRRRSPNGPRRAPPRPQMRMRSLARHPPPTVARAPPPVRKRRWHIRLRVPPDARAASEGRRRGESGGRPRAGSTRYYEATDGAALTSAFRSILAAATDCGFELPSAPPDPSSIEVRLNGTLVPSTSYDVVGTRLELYGTACAQVQSGLVMTITAEDACR